MAVDLHHAEGNALDRKLRAGICTVVRCGNKRGKGIRMCYKHARQHAKNINPVRYYFDQLRGNAKRRGKVFTITIEYFRQFCADNNYIEKKGRGSSDYTIDRIRSWEGYVPGNLQILRSGDNIRKRYIDERIASMGKSPTAGELRAYRDSFAHEDNECPIIPTRREFNAATKLAGAPAPF